MCVGGGEGEEPATIENLVLLIKNKSQPPRAPDIHRSVLQWSAQQLSPCLALKRGKGLQSRGSSANNWGLETLIRIETGVVRSSLTIDRGI